MLQVAFSEKKNILLEQVRGVNFEDVLEAIAKGDLIDDIEHPSKKYPHQRIFVVRIKNYVYAVPYVEDTKKCLYLKTVYPSRILTKSYTEKHDKTKRRKK